MSKSCVITQSNYIPWKGYFDAIAKVDTFVIYDDMQYTKRDWRNRNLIKTPNGLKWLSIPVEVKGKYHQKINETKISDKEWNIKHLNQLKEHYKKATAYKDVIDWVESLYENCKFDLLTDINEYFLKEICVYLKISTTFMRSEQFVLAEGKTERLVEICEALKASDYYTGPAAKNYMEEDLFLKEKVTIHYFDYSGYKEYPQLYGGFEHGVSVLDLVFNTGLAAKNYLKYD